MTDIKSDITPTPKVDEKFQCYSDAVKNAEKKLSLDTLQKINQYVNKLAQFNIKAVMFDFDQTIIETHSKGVTQEGKIQDLTMAVSPTFIVMACLLSDANIAITVGTFSDPIHAEYKNAQKQNSAEDMFVSGPDLIIKTLAPYMSIPRNDIVGYFPDLHPKNSYPFKQYHLKTISEQKELLPLEMAIIDDDVKNTNDAARQGYFAYWVSKAKGIDMPTLETISEPELIDYD